MVKHSHPAEHQVTTEAEAHASGFFIAVNSVQIHQKAATGATLTQKAAAQDWRCGQAVSPSRAPGYNKSSCTRQWLVDRCQLCSSRPKSRNQGSADSTSRGAGLALWSSILTLQSTRLQQKQLPHASGFLIAVNSVQVDQKSRNRGNADSKSRGAGLALWSSNLTHQRHQVTTEAVAHASGLWSL